MKFDEFVQVKDLANQFVITPQTKEQPYIEANGRKVTIKFSEPLLPNTTYRLYFGNAIADMHEGNMLSNFEYVFSTGGTIDSLSISGKINNAFTLKPEKEVTVGLYDKNEPDSVVYKKKPLYFTKTNEGGNYRISYLPRSTFKTFAFTDKNKNLMYDGGEELIAFKGHEITTAEDTIVDLKVFKEESSKVFLKRSHSPFYGLAYIIYNKEQDNLVIPYYDQQKHDISAKNGINDTCIVFYRNIFDTLKLLVKHPTRNVTDTVTLSILMKDRFEKQKKDGKLMLLVDLKPIEAGRVDHFAEPALVFNNWMDVQSEDAKKMILQYKGDSLIQTPLKLDKTADNVFTVKNMLLQGTDYTIILKKGAFKTVMDVENDSMKIAFKTSEASDYAKLNLKLLLPKKEHYIVQLFNEKEVLIAEHYLEMSLTTSAEQVLKFKNLLPGNYFVKVIEDKNQNKKWDTGDILNKKQPESIYFNAQPIKLMADWDSETEWKID